MMRVGTKERRTGWKPLTAAELSSKKKRNLMSVEILPFENDEEDASRMEEVD
jgi:hypothetical protein